MDNIDDSTFLRFIMNDMTYDAMKHTESVLLKNGEGAAILDCTAAVWETSTDGIDIIGDIRKKSCEKDRLFISSDSLNADEPNNLKIMTQLTKKDGVAISKIIASYSAISKKELSLEENLRNFYMNQCPGTFPEEADKIISKIEEGVRAFDSAFDKMVSQGELNISEITEPILKDKTPEERYTILLNTLIALQSLQLDNNVEEGISIDNLVNLLKDKMFKAADGVSEEMISEVENMLKITISEGRYALVSIEALEQLIENVSKGEAATKLFISDMSSLYEEKMIMAVAIMIGINNEEIEAFADQTVSPYIIGSGVAAGMEQQKLAADVQTGNKSVTIALRIFKYICGALLLCTGLYWGIIAISGISGIVLSSLMGVVGTSLTACVATWIITLAIISFPLCNSFGNKLQFCLSKAGQFYDWATNRILSQNSYESSFIDWFKFKTETGEILALPYIKDRHQSESYLNE